MLSGLGVERRHDFAAVLGRIRGAMLDNWRHCEEKKEAFSYRRDLEKVDSRLRLGIKDFDMIAALVV